MPERVLLLGLDGADWRVLRPFLDMGVMPHLGDLIAGGVSGDLRSTVPTNSAVAWPSFLTGRNAGKHGVFDFTLRVPGNPTLLAPADSHSIRSETFLATLGRNGRQVGSINVPVSYPPFPVNGFMLGGMFVQEGRPYTYPESLAAELDNETGGFLPNRIRWRYMLGRPEDLVDEAIAVTQQRSRVLEHLMTRKEWDVLVQVFVSPDRLQHPLMHVLDAEHPRFDAGLARRLAPRLRTYFETLDGVVGRARGLLGSGDNLIVLSDHGMRSVHRALYVREMLIRDGVARLVGFDSPGKLVRRLARPRVPRALRRRLHKWIPDRAGGSAQGMSDLDWPATRAYVTTGTSEGVFVNLRGREPRGTVAPGVGFDRVLERVRDLLLAERDPSTGAKVVDHVVPGTEAFHGPFAAAGPDLLYRPAAGYASAKGARGHLQPYEWFMGDHDPTGILVASGPGIKRGARVEGAALVDIAATVLYLSGVPIPDDMDGNVLDLFADGRLMTKRPVYEQDAVAVDQPEQVYSEEEEEKLEEQLRSLGYL